MKIGIIHNDSPRSISVVAKLRTLLAENQIKIDNDSPTHVISVGGDGTLISAFQHYYAIVDTIKFIAIHTGHLGFYTDWREYELEELVKSLKENHAESVSYPLLEIQIKEKGCDEKRKYLALNESNLKMINETLVCDVYIGDNLFERFRGDGMCVSTPTGSTAYNKSIGGAVLHPRLRALQLTEIASINNTLFRSLSSPMILAPDEWITLQPHTDSDLILTVDSLKIDCQAVEYINYHIAREEIHFAKYRHTHFWSRVKGSFIGEVEDYDLK